MEKSSCECWWHYSYATTVKCLYVTVPTKLLILSTHSHTTALLPCEPTLLQPLLMDAVSDILAVSSVSQSSMCSTTGVGLPLVIATVGSTGCTAAADWFLLTAPRISVCDGVCRLVESDESTKISNVESETMVDTSHRGLLGNTPGGTGWAPWLASFPPPVASVQQIYIYGLPYKHSTEATQEQGNATQGMHFKCHSTSAHLLSIDVHSKLLWSLPNRCKRT